MERIEDICEVYLECQQEASTTIVTSSDEKTGIQAKASIKVQAMKEGEIEKIDSEYTRNGTSCLIAGLDVKTGEIKNYSQGKTRNELDYLNHIKSIIELNPTEKHIIVCDQLNTHKSESLVKYVAEQINYIDDLGVKGKSGILKNMKSRMIFLENKNHRIRFQFTPKHCSWMNQIENWFGCLQRRVIKHGQFKSTLDIEQKVDAFIQYFNSSLAQPINWKFNGYKYRCKLQG